MNMRMWMLAAVLALGSAARADTYTLPCSDPGRGASSPAVGQVVVNYTYAGGQVSYTANYQSCMIGSQKLYNGTVTGSGSLLPAAGGNWAVKLNTQSNLSTTVGDTATCTQTYDGTYIPSQTPGLGMFSGTITTNACTTKGTGLVGAGGQADVLRFLFLNVGVVDLD